MTITTKARRLAMALTCGAGLITTATGVSASVEGYATKNGDA
ncbi:MULTISPECIES: hypothetical protein [Thalassolituus]|nr:MULTISPECIES: hypothetical protein [Thalassolituus]